MKIQISRVVFTMSLICQVVQGQMTQLKGVEVRTLSGGQKLIVTEDRTFPVCSIYLVLKSGASMEPKELEGLTAIMGEMLTRGTALRSRDQIQDQLDQLGAEIDVDVDPENIVINGQTLTRNLNPFLDIFSDVVLHPTFDAKELEKLKREAISGLRQMQENDQQWVGRFFKRALFQSHPYGRSIEGRESTLKKITRKTVQDFYKKILVQDNIFFSATGNLNTDEIAKKLNAAFQALPLGKVSNTSYPKVAKLKDKEVLLVDKPNRTQTQILIGHIGIAVLDPDYFPLIIANNAFGGGMTSRLMSEVRVKRGWSYGSYSWFRARKTPGEFGMMSFPATKDTPDALKLMLSLYDSYAQSGIDLKEFEQSKSNLINEFSFKIDTPRKKMAQLVLIEVMGLPKDYLETYQDKLRAVTLEQVNAAIRKHADSKNLLITILCTAKDIQDKLQKIDAKFKIQVVDYQKD